MSRRVHGILCSAPEAWRTRMALRQPVVGSREALMGLEGWCRRTPLSKADRKRCWERRSGLLDVLSASLWDRNSQTIETHTCATAPSSVTTSTSSASLFRSHAGPFPPLTNSRAVATSARLPPVSIHCPRLNPRRSERSAKAVPVLLLYPQFLHPSSFSASCLCNSNDRAPSSAEAGLNPRIGQDALLISRELFRRFLQSEAKKPPALPDAEAKSSGEASIR